MSVAIITARGGSKRVPRKNIRPFMGRPMIAWPIIAALASKCFKHILVSTEDKEIADIATGFGAEVPFLRPAELADDYTPAHKAARQMLEWAIGQWGEIPSFAHIYPASPFLSAEDICKGQELIEAGKKFAFTAQELDIPIYQTLILNNKGEVIPLFPKDKFSMRSQDMPKAYMDSGQLYWFDTKSFLEKELDITKGTAIIPLPPERGIDIDTEADWQRAENQAKLLDILKCG